MGASGKWYHWSIMNNDPIDSDDRDPDAVHQPGLPWTRAVVWWQERTHAQRVFLNTVLIVVGVTVALQLLWWFVLRSLASGTFTFMNDLLLQLAMLPMTISAVAGWHLVGWWQCRQPKRPSIGMFVGLILLLTVIDQLIVPLVSMAWLDTILSFQWVASVATTMLWYFLVLVVIRSLAPVLQITWIDPVQVSGPTGRPSYSLLGFFGVVSLAALCFAVVRYWINANLVDMPEMPPAWILLVTYVFSWVNPIVAFFGAHLIAVEQQWRRTVLVLVIANLIACASEYVTWQLWMLWQSTSSGTMALATTPWYFSIAGVLCNFVLHAWFIRRWLRAGYVLQITSALAS